FSGRGRHTSFSRDWSSDVCSSDLLLVIGPRLLPDRDGEGHPEDTYMVSDYISELIIPAESELVGKTVAEAALSQEFGIQLLEILRGDERIMGVRSDTILRSEERRVGKECGPGRS